MTKVIKKNRLPIKSMDKAAIAGEDLLREVKKLGDPVLDDGQFAARMAHTKEILRKALGTGSAGLSGQLFGQMADVMVARAFESEFERIECAVAAMMELKSGKLAESLLAIQMTGVHFAATKFLQDAAIKGQTIEGMEINARWAFRLMRLFNEQLDAMAKLKGKTGQQKVIVEHVHVNAGGQAIVGSIAAGSSGNQGEGS